MIKACIFDLDGTLTETVESIARPINRTLEFFGLEPRQETELTWPCGGLWLRQETVTASTWKKEFPCAGSGSTRIRCTMSVPIHICRRR